MDTDKLTNTVNRSGFPLQIGLEYLIEKTRSSHGWKVIFSEHSWKNSSDGSSGFIDLVVENQHRTSVLVVECKRVLETSWIFLIEDKKQLGRRHAKSWVTRTVDKKMKYFGLKDLTLEPTTPQSQYCVVYGEDAKSKPMLERIAAGVVSAAEALAFEEKESCINEFDMLRMYINVIVTTAKLQVCNLNPSDVSIVNGKVENVEFTEVPFLRFRKQLSIPHEQPKDPAVLSNYREIARAKENTVFIVNAEAFPEFLKRLEVDDICLRDIS